MKNEKKFENFAQKHGKKQKAEKLVKNTLKTLQKTVKKNSSMMLKKAIIFSAEGIDLIKQTVKKGKRKTFFTKTLILTSENSRLSKACSNIINLTHSKTGNEKHYQRLSTTIQALNGNYRKKEESAVVGADSSEEKKLTIKFRW